MIRYVFIALVALHVSGCAPDIIGKAINEDALHSGKEAFITSHDSNNQITGILNDLGEIGVDDEDRLNLAPGRRFATAVANHSSNGYTYISITYHEGRYTCDHDRYYKKCENEQRQLLAVQSAIYEKIVYPYLAQSGDSPAGQLMLDEMRAFQEAEAAEKIKSDKELADKKYREWKHNWDTDGKDFFRIGDEWYILSPRDKTCVRVGNFIAGAITPVDIMHLLNYAGDQYTLNYESKSDSVIIIDAMKNNRIAFFRNKLACYYAIGSLQSQGLL